VEGTSQRCDGSGDLSSSESSCLISLQFLYISASRQSLS